MLPRTAFRGSVLLLFLAAGAQAETIAGRVLDAQGGPVAGAAVVVCDRETGIPVDRETGRPFTAGGAEGFQKLLWTLTDDSGAFAFSDAKAGSYRIVAQSWEDATAPIKGPLEQKNGRIVRVCGVAERVEVPSAEAGKITLTPIGNASLDLVTDPKCGNNMTLMVVSSAPMAADPVLAFSAWSGDFLRHMLAANLMPLGRTTVHGLPAGKVHIGALAPDNNPGFGGVVVDLADGQTTAASVQMLATWSDGHSTPPDRLLPLVKRVRRLGGAGPVLELIKKQHPDFTQALEEAKKARLLLGFGYLTPFLDRKVQLDETESVLLKDLMAAAAYSSLMSHFEDRAERRKQEQLKRLGIDRAVSYEQAAFDLHRHLGTRYPYFGLKQIDWEEVGRRLLPRAKSITTDEEFGLLCLEIVAALEDSHGRLRGTAAEVPRIPFPSWDAGFACLVDDRERPVVYWVEPGSPAHSAGVEAGMIVEQVNGTPARAAIDHTTQDIRRYVGYSSARFLRYHAYRLFARQTERTGTLTIEVVDGEGKRQTLSMTPGVERSSPPRTPVPIEGLRASNGVAWKMLDDRIGYISVPNIGKTLVESLDQAVRDLGETDGLIIDVRGNTGGGFDSGRAHRNFHPDDAAEPERPRYRGPIALLVDAGCISAGEGWASWFVANKRARLFGETTAGASSRKASYLLPNGLFEVTFSVKPYKGYLDRPIERTGLVPDVPVMPSAGDLASGRDTVLEAARAELLSEKN